MPQVQYPFIDVAVHPAVRGRFAAGETIVIFSRDMRDVLWANGDGARLFGHDAIYDLIESGPDRASVSYRQLGAAAAQLAVPGDRRSFMMRIASGFRTAAAPAEVSLIEIGRQAVVMFATGSGGTRRLSALLEGFDDPDTHMALIDGSAATQAASQGFAGIGILPETLRSLISAANRASDGLVKRPVATGAGYVPAAIGRLSDDLYLLFCVETSLGRMDAPDEDEEQATPAVQPADNAITDTPVEEEPVAEESARPETGQTIADGTAEGAAPDAMAPVAAEEEPVPDNVLESVSDTDIAELAALDGADEAMVAEMTAEGGEDEVDPDLAPAPAVDEMSAEPVQPAQVADDNLAVLGAEENGESAFEVPGTDSLAVFGDAEDAEQVQTFAEPGELENGASGDANDVDQTLQAEHINFSDEPAPFVSPTHGEEGSEAPSVSEGSVEAMTPSDDGAPVNFEQTYPSRHGEETDNMIVQADFEAGHSPEDEVEQDVEPTSEAYTHPNAEESFSQQVDETAADGASGDVTEARFDEPQQAFETTAEDNAPEDEWVTTETVEENHHADEPNAVEPHEPWPEASVEEQSVDQPDVTPDPVYADVSGEMDGDPAPLEQAATLNATGDVSVTPFDEPQAPFGTSTETSPHDAAWVGAETAAENGDTEEMPATDMHEAEPDATVAEQSFAESVDTSDQADTDVSAETSDEAAREETPVDQPAVAAYSSETVDRVEVADGAEQSEPAEVADEKFAFNRGGRPVRFVWKLDAEGRFGDVSEEFGRAVGPRSGAINGRLFTDLAARYQLDADQEIAGLLERRDTWSGRTIRWPVEGTDLVVPVDLAALPTYSRDREFEGFRGFGIVRVADAESDPRAAGLNINAESVPLTHEDVPLTVDGQFAEHHEDQLGSDIVTDEPPHDSATVSGEMDPVTEPSSESQAEETVQAEEATLSEAAAEAQDEFRGEVPALNIVTNPLASFNDKIIQLEERRARAGREGLSAAEQAALREIARQLEPFGKRPNEELLKSSSGLLQDDEDFAADDAGSMEDAIAAEPPAETVDVAPETDAEQGFEVDAADLNKDEAEAGSQPDDAADEQTEGDEEARGFEAMADAAGLTADAVDQVPLAILIHAGDRLIHANSEFKRLTGYENIAALERAGGLDALIARREGPDGGVYLIRRDGSETMISARLQSVRFEGSSALMLALTPAQQVPAAAKIEIAGESESARQVAALSVEVNELRAILETATDGVIILDTEGRIRSLNRSAAGLFNFDDAETRGKPFAMLFAHESQKSVQDYLSGLAGHGVASVLNDGREVIGREASGGFIPLFMTMGRLPGSNSYCAVIRDITQWKRSEEELRAAKRAAETANQHKSDFLARVSHEIRTPLNAIIGFSDMIASEHLGPAGHTRYVEYASDIGRSGRHVLDIVNDLLDISKIEAGEMDLEFSAVGINDCVSEAVSLVQPQANAQRVIIRTSLSQSVPDVVADLRSIKQIAINILANAIRFTPSGGQIVVSTVYEPTGSVMLRIRDTGVGMSKSELELAMKPFGQVSAGTRQRGEGTGLGLPLTKAMTEANRATFSIHSAPNEGTLVEIVFPPQRVLAD